MPDEPKQLDAKQAADPSPAAGEPADSPPANSDANKDVKWEDFVPTTNVEPAPSAATAPTKPEGETTKPKVEDTPTEGKVEDKAKQEEPKLPFHDHPRWKELLKERDDLKQASEAVRGHVEQKQRLDSFLRDNRITDQQFDEVLQFMALRNSNPGEALKLIKPVMDELNQYEGMVLPQDLAERVDRGTLTEEDARLWAKQRAQAEFSTRSAQQTALQKEQSAQAEALTNWENGIKAKDPDYPKKQQMTYSRYVDLVSRVIGNGQKLTVPLLLECANKAYKEINDELAPFMPVPKPTTKTLTSTPSPSTEQKLPEKWDEVEDFVVNQFSKA